jgi:hypothetical protein
MNKHYLALLTGAAVAAIAARAGDASNDAQTIKDALTQLDPKNDNHWTAGGEARIDTVKSLVGDGVTVTRDSINAASPGFNREAVLSAAQTTPPAGDTGTSNAGADTGTSAPPAPPAAPAAPQGPDMSAAEADGWVKHPTADGFYYKGQDVKPTADVAAMYVDQPGVPSAPGGPQLKADGSNGPDTNAEDISGQTGMGGAMTARSPEPIEGQPRETHVSMPSQGQPGEAPIGVVQGVTEAGGNLIGTPEGAVENAGRAIELSGEVQARNAGSTLTPSQAPATTSSPGATMSLGGAADPAVEANAPGGAVVAEGAPLATTFEGETVGGPFGSSGITAGGQGQTELAPVGDVDFEGDPDTVEALETQLASQAEKTNELRQQIDDLTAQLHTSLRSEAQLRRQIEANRPRSATMTTIQQALRAGTERRARRAREEADVRKALGKNAGRK